MGARQGALARTKASAHAERYPQRNGPREPGDQSVLVRASQRGRTMIHIGNRFMTGQICGTRGNYDFDGYTDASTMPLLAHDDRHITVNAGTAFPCAAAKHAYWKFVGVH